jgi:hypothetical protein
MIVTFTDEVARAGERVRLTITADVQDLVLIRDVVGERVGRIPVSDFPGDVLMAWRKRAREEAKR